jgi:hypothetical protein
MVPLALVGATAGVSAGLALDGLSDGATSAVSKAIDLVSDSNVDPTGVMDINFDSSGLQLDSGSINDTSDLLDTSSISDGGSIIQPQDPTSFLDGESITPTQSQADICDTMDTVQTTPQLDSSDTMDAVQTPDQVDNSDTMADVDESQAEDGSSHTTLLMEPATSALKKVKFSKIMSKMGIKVNHSSEAPGNEDGDNQISEHYENPVSEHNESPVHEDTENLTNENPKPARFSKIISKMKIKVNHSPAVQASTDNEDQIPEQNENSTPEDLERFGQTAMPPIHHDVHLFEAPPPQEGFVQATTQNTMTTSIVPVEQQQTSTVQQSVISETTELCAVPAARDLEASSVHGSLTSLPSQAPEDYHGPVAHIQLSRRPALTRKPVSRKPIQRNSLPARKPVPMMIPTPQR